MKNKLWCDLVTDQERVEFLRSGRAWETGIIAKSIVEDVARAFERPLNQSQKEFRGDPYYEFEFALLELTESICKIHPKQPKRMRILLIVIEWIATKTAHLKRCV